MVPTTNGALELAAQRVEDRRVVRVAGRVRERRALRPDHHVDLLRTGDLRRDAERLGDLAVEAPPPAARCRSSPPARCPARRRCGSCRAVVAGQAGMANTSATAIPASERARSRSRTSTAKGSSTRSATSQTITKLRPEIPSQATSGASGLVDCDSATRPQEKPPYGQVPVTNSRSTQSPATMTGSSPSRPSVGGQRPRHPAVREGDQDAADARRRAPPGSRGRSTAPGPR